MWFNTNTNTKKEFKKLQKLILILNRANFMLFNTNTNTKKEFKKIVIIAFEYIV